MFGWWGRCFKMAKASSGRGDDEADCAPPPKLFNEAPPVREGSVPDFSVVDPNMFQSSTLFVSCSESSDTDTNEHHFPAIGIELPIEFFPFRRFHGSSFGIDPGRKNLFRLWQRASHGVQALTRFF